ncbi:unnamed protein product [Leuciscus chuanchicus]
MDPTLFVFLASVWHLGSLWPIKYSKDYLLTFEKPVISGPPVDLIIPDLEELAGPGKGDHFRTPERRPRRRGRRGGVRERMRRQHPSRIPLPSIILSNARSLRNKTDELQALVRHQHAFKDACILAFSETWLGERDADGDLAIDGFGIPFRTDRTSTTTGKSCGGGVCAYINERWCKNVIVRERLCTMDVELLSLSMRPMYLPREFPQIFVTVVYVHPKANEKNASELISQSVHKLQSLSPDAPNLVLGDFNHCSLDKSLRSFYQSADRTVVHCLLCQKPQDNLSVHLTRVYMKKSTPEERATEVQKAKAWGKEWVRSNRTWDYTQLCVLLPDRRSRVTMVKELLRRVFFLSRTSPGSLSLKVTWTKKLLLLCLIFLKPSIALPISDKITATCCDVYSHRTLLLTTGLLNAASKSLHRSSSASPSENIVPSVRVVQRAPGIKDCQKILRVAKSDVLRIQRDLQLGRELSNTDKTLYLYYCEELLVFVHMQRPRAVEALTDAEWVNRTELGDRVEIGIQRDTTSSMLWLRSKRSKEQLPENIQPEKLCKSFFVSSSGVDVHSVSRDMNRLHKFYKLAPFSAQCVWRAVEVAAEKLPAQQQGALHHYLALSAGAVRPQDVVDAALLLESLGQPPSKRKRVESGFPDDRVFYDKWRTTQYAQREEYLLSHFTVCKPSAAKVARLIAQEGWKVNCPKPEDIKRLWTPPSKGAVEDDKFILRCVSEQTWSGLAIKDFGSKQGVVATRTFSTHDIVCDYHGRVIPAAEGRAMMQGLHDEAGYLFFFKAGQRDLCLDQSQVNSSHST